MAKLKRHSASVAVLLTVTLLTVSFSVFSSTYLFRQPVPQVPVVNVLSASSSTPSMPPTMEWDSTFGGSNDLSASLVIQTSDGGYAIAGTWGNYHYSPPVVWLVKTDSTGKMQWTQTYDYLLNAAGLVQTRDGGYAIAGNGYTMLERRLFGTPQPIGIMLSKTDSNGRVQWSQIYTDWSGGASSMVQTNDGGYIIAGNIDRGAITFNGPYYEATGSFIIKTDASGKIQWNKTYGEPDKYNVFSSVIQTSDGGYASAGTTNFNGTTDIYDLCFWLVKTDANGNVMWNQTYGSGPAINATGNILNMGVPATTRQTQSSKQPMAVTF